MKTIEKVLAIGIILLFIGVAIAPSINFNVVKASSTKDFVEKLKTPTLDGLKYPLLFYLVVAIINIRWLRFVINYGITFEVLNKYSDVFPRINKNPILFTIFFIKSYWLLITLICWYNFWKHKSESKGWNWENNILFPNFPF